MIVFLYGKDTFRSHQKLREIIIKYKEKFPESLSFKKIDVTKASIDELKIVVQISPLFFEKKLIVLKSSFSLKTELQKKLVDFLKENKLDKDEDNILVFWEQGDADKRTSLFKYLEKHSRSQNFGALNKHQVQSWIEKTIASDFPELKLHTSSLVFLAENLGSDLWRTYNELEKIYAYSRSTNNGLINKEGLVGLVVFPTTSDIFKTIDALALKQKKQALRALSGHFKNLEPELKILAMFEYQIRGLVRIKSLIDKGKDYQIIQKETKIHPYAFRKMFGLAKSFTMKELEIIYDNLFNLDLGFKTGRIHNKQIALEMFVVELCNG